MMKRTLAAAALAVAFAAPAFAQSPPSPGTPGTLNKPDAAQTAPMTAPKTSASPVANQSSTMSPTDGQTFVQAQHATDWRGSKLIGATVYGPDNASIGDINDVLIANDGKINAVVIGVGGFLGVGEKTVAIPFDKLQVTRKPDSASIDKITVSYTKEELKAAPKFAYLEPLAKSSTTGSGVTDKMKSLNPMSDKK